MKGDNTNTAKYAFSGLDRIFHEKARLGIMTALFTNEKGLSFNDLKELCGLTDGNLSRHIQILKDENLILVEKSFENNRPATRCFITDTGRDKFVNYMNELENVIKNVNKKLKN